MKSARYHNNDPIGGYLELELPFINKVPYPEALRFQSARSALLALLRAGKPQRVWVPRFICGVMLAPLEKQKIECIWYDINDDFSVDSQIKLR